MKHSIVFLIAPMIASTPISQSDHRAALREVHYPEFCLPLH